MKEKSTGSVRKLKENKNTLLNMRKTLITKVIKIKKIN